MSSKAGVEFPIGGRPPIATRTSGADLPLPAVVVTFGFKNEFAWVVQDEIKKAKKQFGAESSVMMVDLRQTMKQSSELKVEYRKDGSHPASIIKVFSQTAFADVIDETMTNMIRSVPMLVVAGSMSGYRRADVFGRCLTDCVNSLEMNGAQMFAMNHFPTCDCASAAAIRDQFKYALEWAREPWASMEPPADDTKRYGHAEALSRPMAHRTFNAILCSVGRLNAEMVDVPVDTAVDGGAAEADDAEAEEEEDEEGDRDDAISDEEDEEPVEDGAGIYASAKEEDVSWSPQPSSNKLFKPSVGSLEPPPHKKARSVADVVDHEWATALEPWMTTTFDVRNWNEVLVEFGVDKTAIYELFLLSQMGKDGVRHANWIMSKLFKKRSDGQELYNVSAFVHSSVLKSRYQVTNESW